MCTFPQRAAVARRTARRLEAQVDATAAGLTGPPGRPVQPEHHRLTEAAAHADQKARVIELVVERACARVVSLQRR